MANPEHLEILRQGVEKWNRWRLENPEVIPDLTDAGLSGANLSGANLSGADLSRATLADADLTDADLLESQHVKGLLLRVGLIVGLIGVLAFWAYYFLGDFIGKERSHSISPSPEPTGTHGITRPTPLPASPEPSIFVLPTPISYEEKEVAEARKQFGEGKIAFRPPEEMIVSKAETLEVRITHQEQADSLAEGIKGRGKAIVEPLKVSCRMKVTLTAGDAFTIVPITPSEIRLLDPQEPYSSWKWDVTPKKSGVHEIHLIAEAIAELPRLGENRFT